VLGSISLSLPSLDTRREMAVLVREPDVVKRLSNFFDESSPRRG